MTEPTTTRETTERSTARTLAARLRHVAGWFRRDLHELDAEGFEAALDRFDAEVRRLERTHPSSPIIEDARAMRSTAKCHWDADEHTAAWVTYKHADRQLLHLRGVDDLELERQRVCREAQEKLSGWRRAAVTNALTTGDDAPQRDDLLRRVAVARRVLDDHYDNMYLRLDLLRGHLRRGGAVLIVVLLVTAAILALAHGAAWSPGGRQDPFADPWSFVVLATLGAFGAAISGVVRFMRADVDWKVPQLKAERALIWVRPFVGAAAAIVVVGVLASGLAGVRLAAGSALAIALISGFSETLVSRAVAQAANAIAR